MILSFNNPDVNTSNLTYITTSTLFALYSTFYLNTSSTPPLPALPFDCRVLLRHQMMWGQATLLSHLDQVDVAEQGWECVFWHVRCPIDNIVN